MNPEYMPEGFFGIFPDSRPLTRLVFTDRDGTLHAAIPKSYVFTATQLEFGGFDPVWKYLAIAATRGAGVVIVTNQGGIARRLYTHAQVIGIFSILQSRARMFGFQFSGLIACPHHPTVGACLCRKPSELMLNHGIHRYGASRRECEFIGDALSDELAAVAAGINFIHTSSLVAHT